MRHGDRLKTGTIFLAYWIAYSAGRVWIEGLRTDSLMLGGIRVAQLVSLTGMALGILGLVWLYVLKRRLPDVRSPRELRGAEAIPENSET